MGFRYFHRGKLHIASVATKINGQRVVLTLTHSEVEDAPNTWRVELMVGATRTMKRAMARREDFYLPEKVTGSGSIKPMLWASRQMDAFQFENPEAVVIVRGFDERRNEAYGWLLRKGFVRGIYKWYDPPEVLFRDIQGVQRAFQEGKVKYPVSRWAKFNGKKDLLDAALEYNSASIDRFHQGLVGAGLANWSMSAYKCREWEDGLKKHVEFDRFPYGDQRFIEDDLHVGKIVDPRLVRVLSKEAIEKFAFVNRRSVAALSLWHRIDDAVENAAGRSRRHLYIAFRKLIDVGLPHGITADQRRALLGARGKTIDTWLAGDEPAAVFARKQIEKFKAGIEVKARFGDIICERCGGAGFIAAYAHVDGGVCYECGGSGALNR